MSRLVKVPPDLENLVVVFCIAIKELLGKCFSPKIDLRLVYYHIRVRAEDIPKMIL
jgi:hypothetical protein